MALAPRLDLRQSQSLVMTPQLQQAIKLLALSSLEIEAFIAEEVERNPVLETGTSDASPDVPTEDFAPALNDSGERASDDLLSGDGQGTSDALDVDFSVETFHHDTPSDSVGGADGMLGLSGSAAPSGFDADGRDFDSFAARDISLREHLMAQAGSSLSGRQLFLVQQIIEHIEPTGYVGEDLMATAYRLGVPMAEMEAALLELQRFDPTGVGARNLSECLAIQAREADRYDPCMAKLIDNLDLVAKGAFDQLKRMCRVDDEDLRDMLIELRGYDPKPGCRFESEAMLAVTPDIFITPRGEGWMIELNSANLPRILINRSYVAELGQDKATKAWLSDCMADANWLIKAMDQRQRTIVKVATEIAKQQDGFFRKGVAHLRPLTLRQVADAIDMHESTVSRVTSNKYLHCGRGLFDLKYFFSSGVQSADGEGASAQAVKSHIKSLIDAEGEKILSDDTLVDLLTAQGFDIARRTVAKYREAMGIGSSVQRRRQKKMGR
ncbi:RNA polymerase factor sigma-54 [Novosphingobium sp. PASSN1]|uniref:RNA polymerase factor sigma-54 n=1 Tax=Novosphingobium sp. PASSN1 TaxID=2015561 RepID=UPI000BDAAFF3|nr:RNA polymerase factor sigma-54 [Novosphingobium sp. PASSN1]OYU36676.1 MAG: RNA polymerase sigma-54 factor [Novosphingobium sp. PASSN1]